MPSNAQARQFAQLIAELSPRIRSAFMASVTDLQAGVNWPALIAALEQFNTEAAIAALNIDPAAWQEYSQTMTAAYAQSGASTMTYIKQQGIGGIGVRFNMGNPRAEAWIADNVGAFITRVTEEQIDTVRQLIERGYAAGEGPRTIARDIAGRVGPGGTRQGGVLGLDGPRAERLHRVSQGMRTPDGVRGLVVEHLDGSVTLRYKVNRATGNRILKAYRAGEAVPASERALSERQYSNALLQARAETVAATETASAVMNSRDEAWSQAASEQGLTRDDVFKSWNHRRGPLDGRESHIAMASVTVRGLDTPFQLPTGDLMLFPHDPAGGARNNVRCACSCSYSIRRQVE